MKLLIENIKLAGWIMNDEKSELIPSQDFIFIGIRFCTRVGLMFPLPYRIVNTVQDSTIVNSAVFARPRTTREMKFPFYLG
jgi:hypothetical protein